MNDRELNHAERSYQEYRTAECERRWEEDEIKKTYIKPKPFVKWLGGKRQLLIDIRKHFPTYYETYCEPFLGGGAVLFDLLPKNAIVNDKNKELINAYNMIKEQPELLISTIQSYENNSEFYYNIREKERHSDYNKMSKLDRACRFIYLNKTCFNGLHRVNSKGFFNSAYGKYKYVNYVEPNNIYAISNYLNHANITITNLDYTEVLSQIKLNEFVYLDPPYMPIQKDGFQRYTKEQFNMSDQIRLKEYCDMLDSMGVKFLQSNSYTESILRLYGKYKIIAVDANRRINVDASKRGKIKEVLIKNY